MLSLFNTPERQNFGPNLTAEQISRWIAEKDLQVLQTYAHIDDHSWDLLNDLFIPQRPDVCIRVYSIDRDLSFLQRLPNVVSLSVDCMSDATHPEYLGQLKHLKRLGVGIYALEHFNFLNELDSDRLERLSLMGTRSKRPDIALIRRFKNLHTLFLEGQQKGIEAIAELNLLTDLTLRSVSPKSLDFVQGLKKLWSLDIKLGGITDLSALQGMSQIKYLELWQIKGLSDLSVISSLSGLQNLFLQSLRQVTHLPDLSALHALRRVYLENMKGLIDLSALSLAPALEELIHQMSAHDPTDYEPLLACPNLQRAAVHFTSRKKGEVFRTLASGYGIERYQSHPFIYAED